jgi:lysyl-tRNA synthetase class 2
MSDTTHTAAAEVAAPQDENKLIAERREKLKALREQVKAQGGVAFPNDFKPADRAADLIAAHAGQEAEALDAAAATVSVGGRMMLKRVMGKASFATIQDATGRIQIYVTRDAVGEEVYADFKKWDLGDIIGAEGVLMKTKTGELSIKATRIRLLTKSLRPMPDKFHGMADQEQKYRQRYVDLMMDEDARKRFVARSKAVAGIRDFMVSTASWKSRRPCCTPSPAVPMPSPSSPTTTRWTRRCTCASRPSCTSSAWWSAVSSACSRSTATSATKASRCATTPSSP